MKIWIVPADDKNLPIIEKAEILPENWPIPKNNDIVQLDDGYYIVKSVIHYLKTEELSIVVKKLI